MIMFVNVCSGILSWSLCISNGIVCSRIMTLQIRMLKHSQYLLNYFWRKLLSGLKWFMPSIALMYYDLLLLLLAFLVELCLGRLYWRHQAEQVLTVEELCSTWRDYGIHLPLETVDVCLSQMIWPLVRVKMGLILELCCLLDQTWEESQHFCVPPV